MSKTNREIRSFALPIVVSAQTLGKHRASFTIAIPSNHWDIKFTEDVMCRYVHNTCTYISIFCVDLRVHSATSKFVGLYVAAARRVISESIANAFSTTHTYIHTSSFQQRDVLLRRLSKPLINGNGISGMTQHVVVHRFVECR